MDEGTILGLVGKAYQAAYDPSLLRAYLVSLRNATGSAGAYMVSTDPTGGHARLILSEMAPIASETNRKYREHYHKVDAFAHAYRRSGYRPGEVWGSQQFMSDDAMESSELYNGLLRPIDAFYCAGGMIQQNGTSLIGYGVWRSRRQGPADGATMSLLTALMPHQQQAAQVELSLGRLETSRSLTGRLVDALPYGLIALDARGRVLAMNRMAEEIVAAGDGLRFGPDGLSGLRAGDDRHLQQTIAAALAPISVGGTVELPRPSQPRPLRVIVAPVPPGQPVRALDVSAPAALLFVHDAERRSAAPVGMLRRLYDLTPQQARLTALLAGGASLAEAADRLGIAVATATSHLKQVFRKTGARRQSDLIRLLMSLPPDIDIG